MSEGEDFNKRSRSQSVDVNGDGDKNDHPIKMRRPASPPVNEITEESERSENKSEEIKEHDPAASLEFEQWESNDNSVDSDGDEEEEEDFLEYDEEEEELENDVGNQWIVEANTNLSVTIRRQYEVYNFRRSSSSWEYARVMCQGHEGPSSTVEHKSHDIWGYDGGLIKTIKQFEVTYLDGSNIDVNIDGARMTIVIKDLDGIWDRITKT